LSSVRDEHRAAESAPHEPQPPAAPAPPRATRPSRVAKLHVGAYFDPRDPTIMAFQKLKVDLRRSQQDMILEALRDFVAKHEADIAFRQR
jgi:hypothetical protein